MRKNQKYKDLSKRRKGEVNRRFERKIENPLTEQDLWKIVNKETWGRAKIKEETKM